MYRNGFSLASILLLTAVVAVFLAAICSAWLEPNSVHKELAGVCVVAGIVVGGCVGLGVGLTQMQRRIGAPFGLLVGMIAGAAGGALLAVPGKLPAIAIGSLVLVLFGAVVRLYSARPPSQ
jgi:hypothetical protein